MKRKRKKAIDKLCNEKRRNINKKYRKNEYIFYN